MLSPPIQRLLLAVRRRLWRGLAASAVRRASWVTAVGALLAAAVHMGAHELPSGTVLAAVAVIWIALLAQTAARRPADRACALWADQHLGGASAFTTLLDLSHGATQATPAPVVHRLTHWADARVPHSLAQLADRHDPPHLARPLLTMAVCGALAALVLGLPGRVRAVPPRAAAVDLTPESGVAFAAAARPDSTPLAAQIATAMRSSAGQDAAAPSASGGTPAAASNPGNDGTPPASPTPDSPTQTGAVPASARATDQPAPAGGADAARAPHATATLAGSGSTGRQAGDSADARTDERTNTRTNTRPNGDAAPAPRGSMVAQDVALAATRRTAQRQANHSAAAGFDGQAAGPTAWGATALPEPAAATPPPATTSTRLTAPETGYVQAWMKASQASR
jgi:hypothetical protein